MKTAVQSLALSSALALFATLAACGKSETSPTAQAPSTPAEPTLPSPNAQPPNPQAIPPESGTMTPSSATDPALQAGAREAAMKAVEVPIKLITAQGSGADAGSISLRDAAGGLSVVTHLKGLPPGEHGFHVHQNGDCGPKEKNGKPTAGEAAGEHYDPNGTGKHTGPDGMGHAGDLPRLVVAGDGTAAVSLTLTKLKLADVKNRSLMIHAEPDDYAGKPGGARIACGVVP